MKLIYLISAAAVLSSLQYTVLGNENFSLWPRRPEALEQARQLMQENKGGEAVLLLQPYVTDDGIAGHEARQICARVNVPRYLSRLHPGAIVYTVRKGDNMARIAVTQKCPQDVIMLLNGIVEPSSLRIGQKLVVVPMRLRMEIRPWQREISVWDNDQFVAAYSIAKVEGIMGKKEGQVEQVCLNSREGYLDNQPVPAKSPSYPASEKVLILSNGVVLTAGNHGGGTSRLWVEQKDLNELSMLLNCGNEVRIIYSKR